MKYIFVGLISIFLLAACSDNSEEEVSAGRYGMMSNGTPQYTAILFMRSIYNDKNLERALALSDARFARIMQSHHTNRNVQRHLLNLRLDNIEVEPVSGGTLITNDSQKEANIEVKIEGEYNGNKVVDLRTISMDRKSGKWLVVDIKNTTP